jgi:hypothetical protein
VVIEIYIFRFTPAAVPSKNQPPSFVDADRVESVKIAADPAGHRPAQAGEFTAGTRLERP